jgi:peptidoglycan/xylan/chitin deacetylase (PgdA/CDA1 family)
MNWKMTIAKNISNIYELSNTLIKRQLDHRILMYHSIGDKVIYDPSNMYSISENIFKQQMECLLNKYPNNVVGLSTDMLENTNNSVAITFDDGYKDNLYVASPILEELKLSYTVFVSTEYIKNGSNNFLSASELRELSDMPGASIGSHGMTHASLAQCSDKKLKNELVDSRHYIEDVIGRKISSISYPSGSVDQRVVNAAREAGYQLGGTSYNNRNNRDSDKLFLARTCVFGIDTMRVFKQKVSGDWDWLKYIQKQPKIIVNRESK